MAMNPENLPIQVFGTTSLKALFADEQKEHIVNHLFINHASLTDTCLSAVENQKNSLAVQKNVWNILRTDRMLFVVVSCTFLQTPMPT